MNKTDLSKIKFEVLVFISAVLLILIAVLQSIPKTGADIKYYESLSVVQILIFVIGVVLLILSIIIFFTNRNKRMNVDLNDLSKERLHKSEKNEQLTLIEKIPDEEMIEITRRISSESKISKVEYHTILERICNSQKREDETISKKTQRAILLIIYKYSPKEEYRMNDFYDYFIEFLTTSDLINEKKRDGFISYKSQFLINEFKHFLYRMKDLAYHFDIPLIEIEKIGAYETRFRKIDNVYKGLYEIGFLRDSMLEPPED